MKRARKFHWSLKWNYEKKIVFLKYVDDIPLIVPNSLCSRFCGQKFNAFFNVSLYDSWSPKYKQMAYLMHPAEHFFRLVFLLAWLIPRKRDFIKAKHVLHPGEGRFQMFSPSVVVVIATLRINCYLDHPLPSFLMLSRCRWSTNDKVAILCQKYATW